MFRLLAVAALSLCVGVGPALPQAALLPNAKQTFVDQNGNPLSGGKVYSYVPNTTTFKSTWSDSGESTLNVNPVTLDAAGRAVVYGQGSYSQKVTDSLGNVQWNALTTAYGSSSPSGATGTDTAPVGTVMPFSGFVVPTNWQFAYGQAVSRTAFASLLTALTITDTTVSCTSASPTLGGFASTAQFRLGMVIEASCVAPGTMITRILSATSVTVSNNAASTAVVTGVVFPWGNGDGATTFNVPDMRGRVMAGPDAMGGTAAGRLQVTTTISTTSGSAAATVASATGISAGMTVVSTNVLASTTVSSITGTAVTLSANATATAAGTSATFQAFPSSDTPGATGGAATHVQTSAELAAHTHTATVTYNSATSPTITLGQTQGVDTFTGAGSNTPTSSVGSTTITAVNASTGGSAAATIVQPTIAINHIVKMAANTTGAGGVVSVGGMFGDLLCGTNVTCAGQTISFSGTPLLTLNQVYVGNASNNAVSVAMSGDCAIVASGAITCTKSSGSTIGTAAFQNIGTSGANVPLLNTANTWSAAQIIASAASGALAVGLGGATNPALQVDASTASSATGLKIKSAAAAGGAALSVITSGTNEALTIDAAGSGTITLGGTSTGGITLNRAVTLGSTVNKVTLTAPASSATLTIADGKTATHSATTTFAGTDGKTLTTSNSLTLAGTDGTTMTFPSTSATITRTVASGAKALLTAAIASAACTAAQTDTATGTLTTDAIIPSFNADPTAVTGYVPLTTGMLTIVYYPTADTVNFKVCNNTLNSITPGAITLNWRVVR